MGEGGGLHLDLGRAACVHSHQAEERGGGGWVLFYVWGVGWEQLGPGCVS